MNHQAEEEIKVQRLVASMRWVVVAILIVGLGGLGILWAQNQKKETSEKAFGLLFKADKMEDLALGGEEAQDQNKDTSVLYDNMKKWTDVQKNEYQGNLKAVIEKYPGSVPAVIAGIRLGRWNFANQKFEEAVQSYRSVIEKSSSLLGDPDTAIYLAMAYEGMGASLEAQQKFEDAQKSFRDALLIKDNPLKPLAYFGLARNLQNLGKKDEVKGTYEKVIAEFPNSDYEKRARALLALSTSGG